MPAPHPMTPTRTRSPLPSNVPLSPVLSPSKWRVVTARCRWQHGSPRHDAQGRGAVPHALPLRLADDGDRDSGRTIPRSAFGRRAPEPHRQLPKRGQALGASTVDETAGRGHDENRGRADVLLGLSAKTHRRAAERVAIHADTVAADRKWSQRRQVVQHGGGRRAKRARRHLVGARRPEKDEIGDADSIVRQGTIFRRTQKTRRQSALVKQPIETVPRVRVVMPRSPRR